MVRMATVPGESHLFFSNGKPYSNPFSRIISETDIGQEAIVTGLFLLFISNEFPDTVTLDIANLFTVSDAQNDDVQHIDDCGHIKVICPGGYTRPVTGNDRILYKPRLNDETILMYAGQDKAILKDVSGGVNDEESVFLDYTHPLIHFIINNADKLQPQSGDVTRHKDNVMEISKPFLIRVRQYFADNIVRDLRPTRFEDTRFSCPAPPIKDVDALLQPNVTLIFQLNFVLVTQGEAKMKHFEMKL